MAYSHLWTLSAMTMTMTGLHSAVNSRNLSAWWMRKLDDYLIHCWCSGSSNRERSLFSSPSRHVPVSLMNCIHCLVSVFHCSLFITCACHWDFATMSVPLLLEMLQLGANGTTSYACFQHPTQRNFRPRDFQLRTVESSAFDFDDDVKFRSWVDCTSGFDCELRGFNVQLRNIHTWDLLSLCLDFLCLQFPVFAAFYESDIICSFFRFCVHISVGKEVNTAGYSFTLIRPCLI